MRASRKSGRGPCYTVLAKLDTTITKILFLFFKSTPHLFSLTICFRRNRGLQLINCQWSHVYTANMTH